MLYACQGVHVYVWWACRSHQECAAKARKVLQDALELYILNRDFPNGRRSGGSAAIEAAKAAAKRAAAAAIAAGGDGRQLDEASAALLDLEVVSSQLKKLLLPLLRLRQACCHPQVLERETDRQRSLSSGACATCHDRMMPLCLGN